MLNFCQQKPIVVHWRAALRHTEVKSSLSCIPADCVQHTMSEIPSDQAVFKLAIDASANNISPKPLLIYGPPLNLVRYVMRIEKNCLDIFFVQQELLLKTYTRRQINSAKSG